MPFFNQQDCKIRYDSTRSMNIHHHYSLLTTTKDDTLIDTISHCSESGQAVNNLAECSGRYIMVIRSIAV